MSARPPLDKLARAIAVAVGADYRDMVRIHRGYTGQGSAKAGASRARGALAMVCMSEYGMSRAHVARWLGCDPSTLRASEAIVREERGAAWADGIVAAIVAEFGLGPGASPTLRTPPTAPDEYAREAGGVGVEFFDPPKTPAEMARRRAMHANRW